MNNQQSSALQRIAGVLLPAEAVLIVFGGLALALYRSLGLALRDPWALYLPRIASALAWYLTGLLVLFLLERLSDIHRRQPWPKTWQTFRASRLNSPQLRADIRLLNVVSLCFVIFLNLKHLIPYINRSVFDELLAELERPMFGGRLAVEVLQELLGRAAAAPLSAVYMFFYPYMALTILSVIFLSRSATDSGRFILRFVLVWLIGVVLVYAFPTWGPCFFYPETVSALPPTEVSEVQLRLWRYKLFLDEHSRDTRGIFIISGLPSLHLAIVFLGSLELQHLRAPWRALSWLFFLLTAVSTIYFGWHYLADDAAAVLLVLFVILLTRHGLPERVR